MILETRRQDLLYHAKIGRPQIVYLLPEDTPDSTEAERLMVCGYEATLAHVKDGLLRAA